MLSAELLAKHTQLNTYIRQRKAFYGTRIESSRVESSRGESFLLCTYQICSITAIHIAVFQRQHAIYTRISHILSSWRSSPLISTIKMVPQHIFIFTFITIFSLHNKSSFAHSVLHWLRCVCSKKPWSTNVSYRSLYWFISLGFFRQGMAWLMCFPRTLPRRHYSSPSKRFTESKRQINPWL